MKGYPFPPALSAFVVLFLVDGSSGQKPIATAKPDCFEKVILQRSGSLTWLQFQASFARRYPMATSAQFSSENSVDYCQPVVFRLLSLSAEIVARKLTRLFRDENEVRISFDTETNTVWLQANNMDQIRVAKIFVNRLEERNRIDNSFLSVKLEHIDALQASRLVKLVILLVSIVDEDFQAWVIPWKTTERTIDDNKWLLVGGTEEMKQRIKEIIQWLDAKGKKVDTKP